MDVIDAIKNRYSCRNYLDMSIEQNKLETVMEAARLAPSAKNLQDWRFVLITDKQKKEELAEAANNQRFLINAGALIVACSNSQHVMRSGYLSAPINLAIALDHISLKAVESGLATCWIGSFYPDKVRQLLKIPEDYSFIQMMALGYPASSRGQPSRKNLSEIISYNSWNF